MYTILPVLVVGVCDRLIAAEYNELFKFYKGFIASVKLFSIETRKQDSPPSPFSPPSCNSERWRNF